jgi:GNAT superfamily N-acetyltransferase
MKWSKEQIIEAIDAHHWDYEESFRVPGFSKIDEPYLLAWRVEGSNSPYTNRVMKSKFSNENADAQIDRVLKFYGDKPHSWWIGPSAEPADLQERLTKRGLQAVDVYIGLALPVEDWSGIRPNPNYQVIEVATEEDVWKHVQISAQMWDMDERSQQAAFRERMSYLELPDRRGGYVVALRDGVAVGNGAYRFSHDGKTMYLTGSAVLPELRGQGIYHLLLDHRFRLAAERDTELVTVQARVGTSEPILRKLGFAEYGTYVFMKALPEKHE